MENIYWMYLAMVGAFAMGGIVFYRKGKADAYREMTLLQKQMEATKMWTEAFNQHTGGKNV